MTGVFCGLDRYFCEWETNSSGRQGSAAVAMLSEDELGSFEICTLKDMTADKISQGLYPGGLKVRDKQMKEGGAVHQDCSHINFC